MHRFFVALLPMVVLSLPGAAQATKVRGQILAPNNTITFSQVGYGETRIALPAEFLRKTPSQMAVFLHVQESLPLDAPEEPLEMKISGLRFVPQIASCAVDGSILIKNEGPAAVTVMVEKAKFAKLAPGASKAYACPAGGSQARTLRVEEWPHMRAAIYAGEIGVAGVVDERGTFSLTAPSGKYSLIVLDTAGQVAFKRDVEINRFDVDVGKIDLRTDEEKKAAEAARRARFRQRSEDSE